MDTLTKGAPGATQFAFSALHDRVLDATGPDERLSNDICQALGAPYGHVTKSIDAAVALIEQTLPGWYWRLCQGHLSDDALVCPDFNCPTHGPVLQRRFGHLVEPGNAWDIGFDVERRPPGNTAIALCQSLLWAHAVIADMEGAGRA